MFFRPKHTVESVAKALVEGLQDGSIIMNNPQEQPPINSQHFMTTNCTCGRVVEVKKIDDPEYQFKFKCKCGKEVKLQLTLQGS